jgi:hypothetical protein
MVFYNTVLNDYSKANKIGSGCIFKVWCVKCLKICHTIASIMIQAK